MYAGEYRRPELRMLRPELHQRYHFVTFSLSEIQKKKIDKDLFLRNSISDWFCLKYFSLKVRLIRELNEKLILITFDGFRGTSRNILRTLRIVRGFEKIMRFIPVLLKNCEELWKFFMKIFVDFKDTLMNFWWINLENFGEIFNKNFKIFGTEMT